MREEIQKHNLKNGYRMIANDNTFMCYISEKRAQWYLNKNLANVIAPNEIQLKFIPKGLGKHKDPYYQYEKHNICVVCGKTENLSRHHCIPRCFRKYLPAKYKEHNSHDILLMCIECHRGYEKEAKKRKEELIQKYKKSYITENDNLLYKLSNIIVKNKDKLTIDRYNEIIGKINKLTNKKIHEKEIYEISQKHIFDKKYKPWKEIIEDTENIDVFCAEWRKHFVEKTNPQYLPKYWEIYKKEIYNFKEEGRNQIND